MTVEETNSAPPSRRLVPGKPESGNWMIHARFPPVSRDETSVVSAEGRRTYLAFTNGEREREKERDPSATRIAMVTQRPPTRDFHHGRSSLWFLTQLKGDDRHGRRQHSLFHSRPTDTSSLKCQAFFTARRSLCFNVKKKNCAKRYNSSTCNGSRNLHLERQNSLYNLREKEKYVIFLPRWRRCRKKSNVKYERSNFIKIYLL